MLNELGNRMLSVVDKYAKDNGYALILDVSNQQTSSVLFAANGIDVTDKVVALYNAGAATPAAAVPTVAPGAATKPAARPAPAK